LRWWAFRAATHHLRDRVALDHRVAVSGGVAANDCFAPNHRIAGATASPEAEASRTVWLCRPGLADNPCASNLETTVVSADGTSTVESAVPAEDPPIDCFYVYPTVSGQTTVNATLNIDPN